MSKTSQWAGYSASILAIAIFLAVTLFRHPDGEVPGWFGVVTGWLMTLAAITGAVCLVSSAFGSVRRRRRSTTAVGGGAVPGLARAHRRITLED
jgi:hypothetical protein